MRAFSPFRLCLLAAAAVGFLPTTSFSEIQYVIAISVDGLRGDFLQTFIDGSPATFPNFVRLRNASAFTYNARCDYGYSITIPDHLCMLTGRPVATLGGAPLSATHGVTSDAPLATDTVHVYSGTSGVNSGPYKASVFDVIHDRGLSTALYLGKDRLSICTRSWNATNGALDTTGADNGRNKVDTFQLIEAATPTILSTFVTTIQNTTLKNFTFFHIAETDFAGHNGNWSTAVGSTYRNAVITADGWLGQILNAVQNNAALAGKVAIILTADHGGGGGSLNSHSTPNYQENFTIPFFLSAPGLAGGSELYNAFANRIAPDATSQPLYTNPNQPVRNGDVANLATALLGLPVVPGSLIQPELKRPLAVTSAGSTITVTWPSYLTGHTLEYIDDLTGTTWTTVTSGIVEAGGQKTYTFTYPPPDRRHFRLRKP